MNEKKQKQRGFKQGVELIYKYRFVLSFLLLIMLVSFKISGSSMGCWKLFLGDGESGIRLGEPRVWRSDEWGTLTPLCFRQQYNTLGAYNRYSQTLGSILTDNMLVYGQPSWDILTLFRPFYWGYLFFGSERGLSWFWCSRLIVLFLSWFELGMLITDGQKKLSVMLSVCVSFAPFLQWWFAINGLVEMLIYGACFVLGSNYLVSHAFNPRKIAVAVAAYAEENHADVIVFEYLEMQGKISGKNKQKLHLWRKREIQKRCGHQAHRKGIRVSRVCAWNTSRLAYDGSGQVLRDPKNHSLCTFQTGKRYNCDLSASYNIGARYFIRELLKPLPATERSLLEAKVPSVKRRTSCTYADLRELRLQMEVLKAA